MAIVIVLLIILAKANINFGNEMSHSSYTGCSEKEKQALLMFKRDLVDRANRLASWDPDHHQDCCSWVGVVCDNRSGYVVGLNLRVPPLGDDKDFESYWMSKLEGKISPSLSILKHLRYLDLSNNAFEGLLPYQLGNLSNLDYLNLGGDTHYIMMGLLYTENLEWLSGLPLLKHLDLSFVNLSRATNWLQMVNTVLPSLEELQLSGCQLLPSPSLRNVNLSSLAILDLSFNYFTNEMDLGWVSKLNSVVFLNLEINDFHGPIPSILRNMTSLRHLDLSYNYFNSSIPDWLYSFSSLQVLELDSNQLQGDISNAIGNLTSLNELDLSRNELEGKLPRAVGKLCKLSLISLSGMRLSQDISSILEILSGCTSHGLESLHLSNCQLFGQLTDRLGNFKNLTGLSLFSNSISGPIPTSLGLLANLEAVYIHNNLLKGVVSEKHFANHTKLRDFRGSDNSLILRVDPYWVPPFQLRYLYLRSWHVGPFFPLWLRSQKYLVSLDISNSRISDTIPSWFWRLSTQMPYANLSSNQIYGQISYLPKGAAFHVLDLSFNHFSGQLPRISVGSNQSRIDLSNNNFSGSLFHLLCYQLNVTMSTSVLSLANNLLSGEIPDCWIKWKFLMVLRLHDNSFTGKIPSSMGSLRYLQSLQLYNNKLHGEIPLTLKNCSELVAINLGKNELDGNIPRWLGHGFPNLIILILRSNKFQGNIPDHLCALSSLQILDLAHNNLFGSVPRCMSNISAMVRANGSRDKDIAYDNNTGPTSEAASVVIKGQLLEYDSTLNLVRLVDFSRNNLSGEIPQEVTSLQELQSLNLSHNHLSGKIPENIGGMKSLESLDLSQNQLSGLIPESMSSMTFLSHLNLSFNNLTGKIPSSTQLQSFSVSCYAGNHLCGSPLKDCRRSDKEPDIKNGARRNGKGLEVNWFYVSMALGFVTGFWSVVGPLVINRRWRFMYFQLLEQMGRRVCNFGVKF